MSKPLSKKTLLRDFEQDRVDPELWERLPYNGRRHRQYLRAKIVELFEEMKAKGFTDLDSIAEFLEPLHSLWFVAGLDEADVKQKVFDRNVEDGRYLAGILLNNRDKKWNIPTQRYREEKEE